MKGKTDLQRYNNQLYNPGTNWLKRFCWFYINALIFKSSLFPLSALKVFLLRIFGAKVGKNVVIRHQINIKYPWFLSIGNDTWIGEQVWIDNLVPIEIGSNVCVSQGAILLTGNHDYFKSTFDLIFGKIVLKDGVWIGAKAIVCPHVIAEEHSILTAGSIATKNMEAYFIYQGNPAIKIREREIVD